MLEKSDKNSTADKSLHKHRSEFRVVRPRDGGEVLPSFVAQGSLGENVVSVSARVTPSPPSLLIAPAEIHGNTWHIFISGLASGDYTLEIFAQEEKQEEKLVAEVRIHAIATHSGSTIYSPFDDQPWPVCDVTTVEGETDVDDPVVRVEARNTDSGATYAGGTVHVNSDSTWRCLLPGSGKMEPGKYIISAYGAGDAFHDSSENIDVEEC